MINRYKIYTAYLFSWVFHFIALALLFLSIHTVFTSVFDKDHDVIQAFISSINTLVIALAMYELGTGIGKEYTLMEDRNGIISHIRRTITRFVGTVVIALVLEALIMIIKYSQLDLAGNLYYPVAILIATSFLLLSLGGFLALTHKETTAVISSDSNRQETINTP